MFTKLWSSPEIGARIYLQAQMLHAGDLAGGKKDELYGDVLFDVMHKLSAMEYHLAAYRSIEQHMYEDYRQAFQRNANTNAESFPLIFTFEAFVYQLKSTLDMLVKILRVVPLKNRVSTQTYGKYGDEVIRGLRSNQGAYRRKRDDDPRIARLQSLIELIESARDSWLREAVDVRDTVSHFQAAKEFVFTPIRTDAGAIDAARPVFKKNDRRIEPLQYMERLYRSCIEFCQDFMSLGITLFQPAFELSKVDPARAKELGGEEYAHFIKWELTANDQPVRGYLSLG